MRRCRLRRLIRSVCVSGLSLRSIASGLDHAPSRVAARSPQMVVCAATGHGSDRAAWRRATRPKPCKLAANPVLRAIVEEKLATLVAAADRGSSASPTPTSRRCRCRTRASTAPVVQSRGALNKELTRLSAHRAGHPPPEGCSASRPSWRPAEHPAHLRTAGRGRGPGGARALGGRPRLRQGDEPVATLVERRPAT